MTTFSCRRWFLLASFFASSVAAADMPLNMTKGVTDISEQVYDLHMMILWVCVVIGVAVFGVMFWSIYHHRKSKGAVAAQFHESTKVEILWTAIPFVILIGMAVPATNTLIAMEDTARADVNIQVTGSQWKWHYKYLENDVQFYSVLATQQREIQNKYNKSANYLLEVDRPLVIPTNKKVRFLITSDDVIHSWWVPDFAVKKDANPGFINEAWTLVKEPGIYRGQCAELCGKDHGFMPVVVIAKDPADYEKWIEDQQMMQAKAKAEEQKLLAMNMSMEELMSNGERVYQASCAACHQPNGQGLPGVFPAIKDSPIAKGGLDEHIDIVVNGKTGTAMQAFGKQLGLKDLASVITYQRNAWGNNVGDSVQAAQVNAQVNGQ